ncbi:hypothetical protein EDD22DRAFT_968399 [Suillus occidentalis]|nr:hypothetical protein EDD22DRAFT_968399 [Suillus occidentalis]
MDAQRFDPLLRTRTWTRLACQHWCLRTEHGARPLRQDRASEGAWMYGWTIKQSILSRGEITDSDGSCSSPTSTMDTRATSPMPYGHDDIVITRTIIRPNPNPHRRPARTPSRMQMVLTRIFSHWRSPTRTYFSSRSSSSARHRSTPPPSRRSKKLVRVLGALNCISPSSAITIESESNADDIEMHRIKRKRPVLFVIVKESKERYEDDRAFKEIVASVCPAAGVRGD